MNSLVDIKSLTSAELKEFLTENGFKPFRAKQVEDWLKKGVTSFDEMKNMLMKYGNVETKQIKYNTFRGSRNLRNRDIHTKEYLFLLEKEI